MKKKLLIVLIVVLCVAAAGYKVWYDRKQKEAFVDQWIAKGEAVVIGLQTEGWTGYRVQENNMMESLNDIHVLTTGPIPMLQNGRRIYLSADESSDAAIRKVADTLQLVWIRDELPNIIAPNPRSQLPHLFFLQGADEIRFSITLEDDRAILTQGPFRVADGVDLFLDYAADREAVQQLLDRVLE